jgi:hypothetical protein
MLKWLLNRGAKKFSQRYNYDTTYMTAITSASTSAGMKLAAFPMVAQYRGPKRALEVWHGALLASTLDGDCGPCAQLAIDMAIEEGVAPHLLKLCVDGEPQNAGDVGLGFQFSQAIIAGDPDVQSLRDQIEYGFGRRALIAASFATASGRFYPVLKRALGEAEMCSRLSFTASDARTLKFSP